MYGWYMFVNVEVCFFFRFFRYVQIGPIGWIIGGGMGPCFCVAKCPNFEAHPTIRHRISNRHLKVMFKIHQKRTCTID